MTEKKIKVGMDIRPLLKEGSGVGYYIKGLVSELSSSKNVKMKLFSSSLRDRFNLSQHFPGKSMDLYDWHFPVSFINFFWSNFEYPPIEKFLPEIDIVHSPHCYFLPTKKKNQVITIHDLFHIKQPRLAGTKNPSREHSIIKRSAEKASRIITDSNFTKNDIVNILGIDEKKIEVIYCAPSLKPDLKLLQKDDNKTKKTILSVGTLENRKNFLNLLEAFRIAKSSLKDIRLIIVGKDGFGAEKIRKRGAELSFNSGDITFSGYIDEKKLENLYYNADIFVFPSLEEGFGFPPLDAINFGLPVVASRTGALPEILQDSAYYIDHDNPESIAEGIIKILDDEKLQKELISKGKKQISAYSWEKTAENTYDLYRNIYEK